ncbi:MAG: FAD-binding and (Fe-S)-binding domain-containing protein, partial [Nocardioides sp.]
MSVVERLRERIAAERVLDDALSLTKYAADASAYLIRPQAVVLAKDVADIRAVFEVSSATGTPLAFRAAGTSLSGQSQTEGILVEVQRHWRGITVEDGGARIRLRPGTVGAVANTALSRYGVEIGPDPASISACTIGGIVANNSSGMCCGVERNAYHTLESLTFVLADGTSIDSASPEADRDFDRAAPELARGLLQLREEILGDPDLRAAIERKYRLKNTTGYGINAFVDYDTPLGIFTHLLVGSEGTLAFVAEVVLRTIPLEPHRRTALLLYADLPTACAAVAALDASGARAIELMDGPALLSATAALGDAAALITPDTTGLLVEWRAETAEQLAAMLPSAQAVVDEQRLITPAPLHADPAIAATLWSIRKGMLPTIGGSRPAGSSIILEDVVFPPEALAPGTADLRALLDRHGYAGVIFGHAKDGNLHFLVSADFGHPQAADRYAAFMADLVDLVTRHGGALKGEHGTGRNMAPFVEAEWGPHATEVMARLKRLADPAGILNPGTIVSTSPTSHVENLKGTPIADPEIDACVECGFCERGCPSGDLTTTPRQRIVIRRRLADLEATAPESPEIPALLDALDYQVIDTCAADGMCQLACPVGINTGGLVKRLRAE